MSTEPSTGRYFEPDAFAFLRGIARNNNRDWFLKNKERYERVVRDAALRFIREIGPDLQMISPQIVADPRAVGGSLGRIYRDIRFSKDKSPYKTNVGIHFSHRASSHREGSLPGFYFHLAPDESFVASGMWRPEAGELTQIRKAIVGKSTGWKRVRDGGIELGGESLKRPPPGFDPAHPFIEDLKRKDFIASESLKEATVTGPRFRTEFLGACNRLDPLNRFLADAIHLPW